MDQMYRKVDEKTADSGDLKNSLLQKLFHDLDIADFMPNRDRGDSKTNTIKRTRILINNNEKQAYSTPKNKTDKRRSIEITVSEVKPKKVEEIIIENETEPNDEKKKLEECKTALTESNSNKFKNAVSKNPTSSEKVLRFKPEAYREDKSRAHEKLKCIDEKYLRNNLRNEICQRYKRTDENSRPIENKINITGERHETFKRVEIAPRIGVIARNENCGTDNQPGKLKVIIANAQTDGNAIAENNIKNPRLPPKEQKTSDKNLSLKGPVQSYEARKLLRQKYTVKLKGSNKNVGSKDDIGKGNWKNDHSEANLPPQEEPKDQLKDSDIRQSPIKAKKTKETDGHRKPIIKTIRFNNDSRVYKAVTFVEDRAPIPPLQIKIPNQKKSVETNTMKNKIVKTTLSKVSLIEKRKVKVVREKKPKREKLRNRPSSPMFPTVQGCSQTEVAKWAPSSINQLTKPYYEAWVDTTLTAITKCTEDEKQMINQQNNSMIRTFKRAIDLEMRPDSPDLVYEKLADEKFLGKITVKQRR